MVIDNEDEWDEESDVVSLNEGPVEDWTINKPHVIYMMQEVWVDLTGLDIATEGERIYQGIRKMNNPDEFYEVVLVIGKNTMRTGIKVGYNVEAIESLFREKVT